MIVIGAGIVNNFLCFIRLKAAEKSLLKIAKKSSIFFKFPLAAPPLDWRRFCVIWRLNWQMSRVEIKPKVSIFGVCK